jgi:hypothetical protein
MFRTTRKKGRVIPGLFRNASPSSVCDRKLRSTRNFVTNNLATNRESLQQIMSRGLGRSQTAFLAALVELDTQHGVGTNYHLLAVLHVMTAGGLKERFVAVETAEQAQIAAYHTARAQHRAEAEARARAGDAVAIIKLDRIIRMSVLAGVIRGRHESLRGRYAGRASRRAETLFNPSRIAASLTKRGLVRSAAGAYTLTPAGQELVKSLQRTSNGDV